MFVAEKVLLLSVISLTAQKPRSGHSLSKRVSSPCMRTYSMKDRSVICVKVCEHIYAIYIYIHVYTYIHTQTLLQVGTTLAFVYKPRLLSLVTLYVTSIASSLYSPNYSSIMPKRIENMTTRFLSKYTKRHTFSRHAKIASDIDIFPGAVVT